MAIFDYSGTTWVSAFNDQAKDILGISANELKNLQDTDEQAFEAVFTKVRALNSFLQYWLVACSCSRALFHWVSPQTLDDTAGSVPRACDDCAVQG